MTDPDRPMKAEPPTRIALNLNDYDRDALALVLHYAIQAQGSLLDQATGGTDWRVEVYAAVVRETTAHVHEGTGSGREKDILRANELLAKMLGVSNS
ncbi:MAG: hypothetical protein ACXIUV_09975 [Alkalilacustris sp.]